MSKILYSRLNTGEYMVNSFGVIMKLNQTDFDDFMLHLREKISPAPEIEECSKIEFVKPSEKTLAWAREQNKGSKEKLKQLKDKKNNA